MKLTKIARVLKYEYYTEVKDIQRDTLKINSYTTNNKTYHYAVWCTERATNDKEIYMYITGPDINIRRAKNKTPVPYGSDTGYIYQIQKLDKDETIKNICLQNNETDIRITTNTHIYTIHLDKIVTAITFTTYNTNKKPTRALPDDFTKFENLFVMTATDDDSFVLITKDNVTVKNMILFPPFTKKYDYAVFIKTYPDKKNDIFIVGLDGEEYVYETNHVSNSPLSQHFNNKMAAFISAARTIMPEHPLFETYYRHKCISRETIK